MPPMFCMLLRKHLEASRIIKINVPQDERILEFYFDAYNEIGENIHICLAIELMGKHSNVILYNYDNNVIIGCCHNVGAEKSREREMMGGLPYIYPSSKKLKSEKALKNITTFFSEIYDKTQPISEQIDKYFECLQEKEILKSSKQKLLTEFNNKLKKNKLAIDKQNKQLKKSNQGLQYKKNADLLMANLFNLNDYSKQVEIVDFETNSPVIINLDEKMSIKENANRFYKLYTKSKTAILKSEEFLEKFLQEKKYFEEIIYFINNAETFSELEEMDFELNYEKNLKIKQNKNSQKNSIQICKEKIGDFEILIGKNSKQNDYIISKLADDEDLWFHTKDFAGSHVLLKTKGHFTIPDEMYLKCCEIAKENSAGKNSTKVGIIYTQRKYVKKPPKAPLGYVIDRNEYEIIVD